MPISAKKVLIEDTFMGYYTELVRNVVIPYQWEALNDRVSGAEPSYAVRNFKIAAGLETNGFGGLVFQDSDVAKWLESVGHSLETHPDAALEQIADSIIEIIIKAQLPNGYLDTYFILNKNEKPWSNLCECHELYCAGHMIEAAVAYYRGTGKRELLDVACRLADLVDRLFGPEENKMKGYPGHQEIELALVKLYRATGEDRYLRLSKFFIDERGKAPHYFISEWEGPRGRYSYWSKSIVPPPDLSYHQAHKPVRTQEVAVGHAVRAVYMYSGMADVALETGDNELLEACMRLWRNITGRQMYITGGIGSTHHGEAFSFDYDLPNDTVYAETCASIGLVFFAHRLLQSEMKGEYGDVIEKVLYNLVPGSISRSGKEFFYVNPLEVWPEASEKNPGKKHVKPERQKWFGCACCPPNIARLLASLGEYIYSQDDGSLYIHQYVSGSVEAVLEGKKLIVSQESCYPYSGEISICVTPESPLRFGLSLRIPGWCRNYEVLVNGAVFRPESGLANGYLGIERTWSQGDKVSLVLDMPVNVMTANPNVRADAGKVCLQRGPLVYCLEEADNGSNLAALALIPSKGFECSSDSNIADGTIVISGQALRISDADWEGRLYKPLGSDSETPVAFKAIPYYLWGNRGAGEMQVWCRAK